MNFFRTLAGLTLVAAITAAIHPVTLAQSPPPELHTVSAGYDLFSTDLSGTDLLGIPFEGDGSVSPTFDFIPPPVSANARRAIGDTDTVVHRLENASVSEIPGTADPITIELVLLRLVSTTEFDLDGDGALDDKVFVTLQKDRNPAGETRLDFDVPPPADPDLPPPPGPIEEQVLPGPRSFGEMTIHFASAQGGTFDSRLEIFADLRRGSPSGDIVCGETLGLPPCSDLDEGLILESSGADWGRQAPPNSITIRGVNFSLAAPGPSDPVDTRLDFWAGVDPFMPRTICVEHFGHDDPGGEPTAHRTCQTFCTTQALSPDSCRNGKDDDCNGTIDDCDEDLLGPVLTAPADRIFECPVDPTEVEPKATGFATASDNCFPRTLPAVSITHRDFDTPQCGRTFLLDRVWSATDDCGNPASVPDLQQIHVVDTTAPDITCPVDRIILWTDDPSPASLGSATGSDLCNEPDVDVDIAFSDVSVPGVCRSEEIVRTWLATDQCGLETPCDQQISVRGPKDAIEDLNAELSLIGLPDGPENALSSTLRNGVDSVCDNRSIPAVNQLEAFIHQVEAQSGQLIEPADADRLIAAARAVIAAIQDPAQGGACPEGCGDTDGNPGGGDGNGGGNGGGGGGEGPGNGGGGNGGGPGNGGGDDPGGDPGDGGGACPDSDTRPTVVIDGCDTGVDNVPLDDGCTISDRISDCAEAASEHGGFVLCVAELHGDLARDGVISGRDRGAIQRCAARADLP